MAEHPQRFPMISAGVLLGAGLGGFADGIVLHQILQWHHMLSSKLAPDTLVSVKVNMYWDGLFHAAVWVMTVVGLAILWRVGKRQDVPWSGKTLVGSMLLGWGLFNLIEGIIDHQLLGLHHVYEYTSRKVGWDLAFLTLGALLVLGGGLCIRAGRQDAFSRIE